MKELIGKVIAVASDHAGFDKKQVLLKYFSEKGIAYEDIGSFSDESSDYSDFGHLLGDAIDKGKFELAVSFCGSGQGINMTANKHQKVRSALCWAPEIAELAKLHNNANVCAIPARFVSDEQTIAIVEAWLNTRFEGGRHEKRIEKIPLQQAFTGE